MFFEDAREHDVSQLAHTKRPPAGASPRLSEAIALAAELSIAELVALRTVVHRRLEEHGGAA